MTDNTQNADKPPKISIMLITYNHGKYIAQALESILMQETEYSYEINVIEDCSTDNTQEVVMRYVEKYPHIVKPFFNKKNIGFKVTQKNFFRGFKTLKGDYIAILEGDDYWSSPQKLQKQIAFLEANPGYAACSHNTIKVYEDGSREPHRFMYWENMKQEYTLEDFIYLQAFFHTTTLIYRNVFHGIPPKQFISPWSCDIFITIAHMQFGKCQYFDEDMAVYRAHSGGRFSNMRLMDGWFFNIGGLRRYNQWLGYRHCKAFAGSIARYCTVVLRDAGKLEETAPLTIAQLFKYASLRSCYKFIYLVLEGKDTLVARYAGKRGMGLAAAAALTPFHLAVFAAKCFLAAINAIGSTLYWAGVSSIPTSFKSAVFGKLKKWFYQEDIRHLYWLALEGNLFTRKGLYHFKCLVLFCLRKLCSKALKILRFLCTPFIILLRPVSKPLAGFFPREELKHLRDSLATGGIFSRKSLYHLKCILLYALRKTVSKLYQLSAPSPARKMQDIHDVEKPANAK